MTRFIIIVLIAGYVLQVGVLIWDIYSCKSNDDRLLKRKRDIFLYIIPYIYIITWPLHKLGKFLIRLWDSWKELPF